LVTDAPFVGAAFAADAATVRPARFDAGAAFAELGDVAACC
jgi:hypothetical protein